MFRVFILTNEATGFKMLGIATPRAAANLLEHDIRLSAWSQHQSVHKGKITAKVIAKYKTKKEAHNSYLYHYKLFGIDTDSSWANHIVKKHRRAKEVITPKEAKREIDKILKSDEPDGKTKTIWITNQKTGKIKKIQFNDEIPPGWVRGRLRRLIPGKFIEASKSPGLNEIAPYRKRTRGNPTKRVDRDR